MNDPVFGPLLYRRGAWEGQASFTPVRGPIEIMVPSDRSGPSLHQREFFSALQVRYATLWPDIERLLTGAREDPARESAFTLVGARLPGTSDVDAEWKLWFKSRPVGWFYSVEMQGWAPVRVGEER